MPTITLDLPDNVNFPANWDAKAFFVKIMSEAGVISSDQAEQVVVTLSLSLDESKEKI